MTEAEVLSWRVVFVQKKGERRKKKDWESERVEKRRGEREGVLQKIPKGVVLETETAEWSPTIPGLIGVWALLSVTNRDQHLASPENTHTRSHKHTFSHTHANTYIYTHAHTL